MSRVKIKGTERVIRNIKDTFNATRTSRKLLSDIGLFSVDRIQRVTRGGKSIVTGRKLKKLSKSYLEMRRGAMKWRTINGRRVPFPEPDERLKTVDREYFDPDLSQLTFTGQMLRALRSFVNSDMLIIYVKASSRDDGLTNKDVAEFVKANGRPFIGMDKKGIKRIKRLVLDEMRRQMKKSGFK